MFVNTFDSASRGIKRVALALALGVAGCAGQATQPLDNHAREDARTATQVRAALINRVGSAASTIDVQVDKGVVTLTGSTNTAEERAIAVSAAQRVLQVKTVNNQIGIGSGPTPTQTARPPLPSAGTVSPSNDPQTR